MFKLGLGNKVTRVGKRRNSLTIFTRRRVAARVIKVQMSINDDSYVFRLNICDGTQALRQRSLARDPYMSMCLADHFSPMPVSINIRSAPVSMNTQFMFILMRFCSSGGQTFDHSVRGTTPNIAPPSRRNSVSGTISTW